MNYLPHLATRVFDTPILMAPQKMEIILGVLGPKFGIEEKLAATGTEPERRELKPFEITEDGIAVIPIEGTLVHKSYGLDAMSGMRSYADIQHEVESAAADRDVKAILLDIDSPGGEVAGSYDLADVIFAARSMKPVYAVANNDAFSGAYLLASSADRIYVSRTSGVGSIGVIVTHLDVSASDEKLGYNYTIIHAGARKADFSSHAPLSDEARAVIESEVERTYGLFVSTVSRNRGLEESAIRKTEAGLFFGQDAIDKNLADKLGTRQDALADLRALSTTSRTTSIPSGRTSMNQETVRTEASEQTVTQQQTEPAKPAETAKTVETIQPAAPAATVAAPAEPIVDLDAIRAEAQQQGYAQAREIVELCTLAEMPDKAVALLKQSATPAKARQALMEARAAADPVEIHSHTMPETGTKVETSVEDSPVVKAVERMAKQGVN